MPFPKMLTVRQKFPDRRLADIPGAVRSELEREAIAGRVPAGRDGRDRRGQPRNLEHRHDHARRGGLLESRGRETVHFPGHGKSWRGYRRRARPTCWRITGLSKRRWAVRSAVRSTWSRSAPRPKASTRFSIRTRLRADGIMVIGRVKWHTDFEGKLESGLFKMMAIGLGKWAGAQHYHAHAYTLGLEKTIRSIGRQMLGDRQDSRRPCHSGRRPPQHRASDGGSGGRDGSAGRKSCWSRSKAGWVRFRWRSTY